MTAGRLIAVVGPSGVGKDSVMYGMKTNDPRLHLVRRIITRAPDPGGEDHAPVSAALFHEMVKTRAFVLHWGAHGLFYGIPVAVKDQLAEGSDCLVNLSRTVLPEAADAFPDLIVLHITARPETLARRLAARGRESGDAITDRLARAATPLPEGLNMIHLSNDGPLFETVARAAALLRPAQV